MKCIYDQITPTVYIHYVSHEGSLPRKQISERKENETAVFYLGEWAAGGEGWAKDRLHLSFTGRSLPYYKILSYALQTDTYTNWVLTYDL